MTSQGNQPTKLEKIANVFLSLAETHAHNTIPPASEDTATERPLLVSGNMFPEPPISQTSSTMQTPNSPDFQECATPFDVDISTYSVLNWFNYPGIPSIDIQENESLAPAHFEVNSQTVTPSDIFGPITSQRGRKRPLEGDFDWLSWDLSASTTF
jgi:hypothetical protein